MRIIDTKRISDIKPVGVLANLYRVSARDKNTGKVYFYSQFIKESQEDALSVIYGLLDKHGLFEIETIFGIEDEMFFGTSMYNFPVDCYIIYTSESPSIPFAEIPF